MGQRNLLIQRLLISSKVQRFYNGVPIRFHLLGCSSLLGYYSFQASPEVLYIFPYPAKRCASF